MFFVNNIIQSPTSRQRLDVSMMRGMKTAGTRPPASSDLAAAAAGQEWIAAIGVPSEVSVS